MYVIVMECSQFLNQHLEARYGASAYSRALGMGHLNFIKILNYIDKNNKAYANNFDLKNNCIRIIDSDIYKCASTLSPKR